MQNDIKTERLILHEMTAADWAEYVAHVTEADELFVQYGIEPDERLIEFIKEPTIGVLYRSIALRDTGETVGYIGVYEEEDNLEFYVFREYRRRHYCAEEVGAFIKAYLSGVLTGTLHDRVIAETLWENGPAAEMLKKAGFMSDAVGFKLSENRENNIMGTWRLKYE